MLVSILLRVDFKILNYRSSLWALFREIKLKIQANIQFAKNTSKTLSIEKKNIVKLLL